METGAPAHTSSVAAQTERRMDVQVPLTAVYIHTVPAVPTQPFPQPPLASPDPTALQLAMPPHYSKETLPFLTLHIASGLQPGMSVTAAAPTARPKSAGKHMCPHCGRDCMKPSVLEKHLRCHTGERPYPCTICGVSFKTQSNLYKHKRTQAHARLSSESEHSNLSSLDSMSSSTETTSLSVEERSDCLSAGLERDLPVSEKTPVVNQNLEQNEKSLKTHDAELLKHDDNLTTEKEYPAPLPSRHLLLQRQEATLFSKQWENSASSSKSQSHESTDSGFSESSDHYPSPGSLIPDHSMDSLTESTTEHLEDCTSQLQDHQEAKDTTKQQEHKSLEERISKLISENSAVVEDKHLENVRPRKTVLSKQGSIDLPMPYTYKDSFHFDMRINKMSNVQRNRKPGLYNSVPTQQSTAMDHAPLTRSNSLPFSVTLLQPDRSSPTSSSYHRDYTTLFRRGSSGQIHPAGFSIKSVNQQLSTHRPLVRQAAVDCNHASDTFCKNSSVEEACTSSPQCSGEAGDICGEPSKDRKFRRKKAQKFAYNKWYMYGGGTFKKLYDTDRGGESSPVKAIKSLPNPENEFSLQNRLSAGHKETTVVSSPNLARSTTVHNLESYPATLQLLPSFNTQPSHVFASSAAQRMPLRKNLSLSLLPLSTIVSFAPNQNIDPNKRSEASNLVNEPSCSAPQNQVHVPSDRKKQKTDDKLEIDTDLNFPSQLSSTICSMTQPNLCQIIQPKHSQLSLFPASTTITANASSVSSSPPATSVSSTVQSSFMPKYQLKLPNASSSLHVGGKLAQNDSVSVSTITTLSSTKMETVTTWTYQNICSLATSQFLPCTVSQALSQVNVSSPSTVVHQRPVADTKTTTSLRNSHALIHCSPFGTAMPLPPTTTSNKTISGPTFTSIHRTQSAPAAFAVQSQQLFPSNKSFPSPLVQSSQSTESSTTSNISPLPCQVIPGQQAAPKVFHMQTADLQISFQILSDEQLALIEPQIEKQTDTSLLQTGHVDAMPNQVPKSNTVKSNDDESGVRQSEPNQEMHKDITKPSICNKSEKEQPNTHMTQVTAIHPHIQVNKVTRLQSSEEGETSTAAPLEGAKSERSQIADKESVSFESFAAQNMLQSKDSNALSDKQRVTSVSPSLGNNERTNCKGNVIKNIHDNLCSNTKSNNIPKVTTYLSSSFGLEQDRSDRGTSETCTRPVSLFPKIQNTELTSLPRNNPLQPMLSLSQQANPGFEKMGLSHDLNLTHEAGLEQSAVVTSASADVPLAAPRDVPAATGLVEGGSVMCPEPQTQSHGPQETETDTATYIQLESKAEDHKVRAPDYFPNSWISEQHLQHLSQTSSGMCAYPSQSSGPGPTLSSNPGLPAAHSTDFCDLPPFSLLKTNCYSLQESGREHLQAHTLCEANLNKLSVKDHHLTETHPTVSGIVARCQETVTKQDQRLEAENFVVSCSSTTSHTTELTRTYQSSSSLFINPLRPSNTGYSEHISHPPQVHDPIDGSSKYPSLFGAGLSYSYQPGDPLSSAVRVVQSSVDQEDSSSDDEGKLIIEL